MHPKLVATFKCFGEALSLIFQYSLFAFTQNSQSNSNIVITLKIISTITTFIIQVRDVFSSLSYSVSANIFRDLQCTAK